MLNISCAALLVCALAFALLAITCHRSLANIPPDEQAIAEVEAGGVDTAHAVWWGFDREDATKALQAALNSRARRVIVDHPGHPWVVTPLTLRGDKEIIFQSGVVVEAKQGKFLGKGDCLLLANGCQHLTLRGKGATLRMHKDDYHHPPYEPAEWRHCLSLRGCKDVLIDGLTLQDSGGDGIYLGAGSHGATNVDITIRNVTCVGNNRQGVSIITAENLLMENCTFRTTSGTAPQAGVDFEPNSPTERLVNCTLRNCRSENNAGCGYLIYLGNMSRSSQPVSIRFEACSSKKCRQPATYLGMANRDGKRSVTGRIEYVKCHFDADAAGGVVIRGNEVDGCRLQLRQCEIVYHDSAKTGLAPIAIEVPRIAGVNAGNIEISECRIHDSVARNPIDLRGPLMAGLPQISGSLVYASPEGEKRYVIDHQQLSDWFPERRRWPRSPRFPSIGNSCSRPLLHTMPLTESPPSRGAFSDCGNVPTCWSGASLDKKSSWRPDSR